MANNTTASYTGSTQPFDREAEQAVLGAVLLDSSCLDTVMEILPSPDYFSQSSNADIYDAMLSLSNEGRPVDYVTLLDYLRREPGFEENDGKGYLLELAQIVPSISNVETYAHIVRDKYELRILIQTARSILEEAAAGTEDSSVLLDSAEQKIYDIRRGQNMQGLQRINQTLIETFDRLDLITSPEGEQYRGIPTGIRALDDTITGLNRTDLILLAARPGMGKTSFALNITRHAAVTCHKRVAFFSLEMTREQLASRMLSTEAQVSGVKLRSGKLDDDEWPRLIEAGDVLSHTEIYFDDNSAITVPEMKAKLRRLKDVDLVVIDYLQLMSSGGRIDNRVQEISAITRNLKIMAKELNVPVLCLSQLSRESEKRTTHKPMLSDLRDSGSIEQDADIVLFLYREGYYANSGDTPAPTPDEDQNSGECIVAKNRHGETRSVPLHWQGEFMRFTSQELVRQEP
ncbi:MULTISPECIES: replicative DNA helicase [Caproicibacterium]|jgi:replicative DNA helicase|uniref:Replicative DNA helicase n=1 Tax=Caproicibacterium lactatifermentans TaxID=2666138 RepID=A0A859DND1_9FIRM|nr:replicative DNA helicase [Caproicibacterium lactatifermentans]ARP50772.1 replicative DNA helicase [Ruminococcaceae bacterium CPB6]MDD4808342.1 replicative DNA helicase [Oscillospiraceae bacterium]QKN23497.1 replicative DNA helicase [Caproicibacterium lactatifermentans]QKO29825.1 replicative DNA helicase [Caproicibacterium lactatifermentans]